MTAMVCDSLEKERALNARVAVRRSSSDFLSPVSPGTFIIDAINGVVKGNMDAMDGMINFSVAAMNDLSRKDQKTFYERKVWKDEFLKVITTSIWSPIIFEGSKRAERNFLRCGLIGLDFDNGKLTLQNAIDMVDDWNVPAIIGVTKSHQKEKNGNPPCDRFRIVMRASSFCTDLQQYKHNMREYIKKLPADNACKGGAQLFRPCAEIVYQRSGEPIDWLIAPAPNKKAEIVKQKTIELHKQLEKPPQWMKHYLTKGTKKSRHNATYAVGKALVEFGFELDEIISVIMESPLSTIGEEDVREACWYARRSVQEGANPQTIYSEYTAGREARKGSV